MIQHHQSVSPIRTNTNQTRPTIGYFAFGISGAAQAQWAGVVDAAQQYNVNLICWPGQALAATGAVNDQANILYDLGTAQNMDGIVSWTSTMDAEISADEIRAFYDRYRPLPVVSIGRVVGDLPTLLMESYQGMREVLAHLLDVHQYRRLAFIQGPAQHIYAQERYRAYREALKEYGLPFDPNLVTPPSTWSVADGMMAMRILLDDRQLQPRRDFDVVVSANDHLLLGALEVLQSRGIQVPEEVAVTGFDNTMEGRTSMPPFTSVAVPYYQVGYRAVETVLALIAGHAVPPITVVPSQFVLRQSCGCFDPAVVQAGGSRADPAATPLKLSAAPLRVSILETMRGAIEVPSQGLPSAWAEELVDAFTQAVNAGTPETFLRACESTLRHVMLVEGDVFEWQNVISAMHRQMWSYFERSDPDLLRRAEALWQQARVMIGETAQRAQARREFQAEQQTQVLQEIGQTLITIFDVEGLMQVLVEKLPQLKIPGCLLALYEDPRPYTYPQPAPEWSRLIMAYTEQGRVALPEGGCRFLSRCLMPENVVPHQQRSGLVALALYFREQQIGFMLVEIGPRDGSIYHALRGQISSALQGALLMQRVQAHSAEIARQKYILDTFLETVPDRIWFKDQEGRYLRANQAHARRWGLHDPAEEIGKTDVDLMPSSAAQVTNADERKILDTGVPLLNKEAKSVEPDGSIKWSLVTKMPLRDEHGVIIGTFGIARDITDLKKAQQALTQAYSEISVLNAQLQEENVRMSTELDVVKQLQQMILPRPEELCRIPGLDIVGYMQPSDEVGGDYYDVLHADGVLHIGIGDVTGHGLESGLLMLMTQAAIRTLIEHGETDPVKFVNTLNRLIYKNAARIGSDKNLTFALVQYQGGQFKLVGQHEELLVVRQGGQVERVDTMNLGFPVGLEPEIGQWVNSATITLRPGDGLVLYTDGITEAENTDRQQYGLDRLCVVLSRHWSNPAEAIKHAVVADVMQHIGTQKVYDDITLVVLKQQ